MITPDLAHSEGFTLYRKGHPGNAATLKHYWTKNPEGLAKWATARQPFHALVEHLQKFVKDPEGLAATYYHAVFGVYPNQPKKAPKKAKAKRNTKRKG